MKDFAYYNGKSGPISEMTIPINDRSTYFGDGVYEAALVLNKKIFSLKEHVDRLYRSCDLLRIDFDMPRGELEAVLKDVVSNVDSGEQMLYWQVTRGTGARQHAFIDARPNLLVTSSPKAYNSINKTVKLITLEDTRYLHCNIKTLNLIPNVMASQLAAEKGCFEAVFHRGDRVTECSHSNVSILTNGVLKTAPADNMILAGVTRGHLVTIAKELGVPVLEEAFTLDELMNADEVIVSSTTIHCVAATEIDGKPVGGRAGELLGKIQSVYLDRLEAGTGYRA